MSKIIQALLSGMFFTFILDFFIFLGIFEHYIKENDIHVYYNILFADHQSIFIYLGFSILLGYITLYKSTRVSLLVLLPLFCISFGTLIPPFGNMAGELLLMQKNVLITTRKFSYQGNILYKGRNKTTFYDNSLEKKLIFTNNKILKGI